MGGGGPSDCGFFPDPGDPRHSCPTGVNELCAQNQPKFAEAASVKTQLPLVDARCRPSRVVWVTVALCYWFWYVTFFHTVALHHILLVHKLLCRNKRWEGKYMHRLCNNDSNICTCTLIRAALYVLKFELKTKQQKKQNCCNHYTVDDDHQ